VVYDRKLTALIFCNDGLLEGNKERNGTFKQKDTGPDKEIPLAFECFEVCDAIPDTFER